MQKSEHKKELLTFNFQLSTRPRAKREGGQSVVEIVLAIAIFVISVSSIYFLVHESYVADRQGRERAQAVFLAEEGIEASRSIRDNNFTNLTVGNHGLLFNGVNWIYSGASDAQDQFTRQVIISDIATNKKKIVSKVTWNFIGRSEDVTLTSYLNNWESGGTRWMLPTQESSLDLSGTQNGLKIQTFGNYAYVVRDDATPDFAVVNISTTTSPSISGSLNLTGSPTNITISGSYAYVSSRDNNQELQIIDISNPSSPSVIGTYNAPGNADGLGVFVAGAVVYLTRDTSADNEFLIIDVSMPSSPSIVGSLDLGDAAYDVVALGSYAYTASANNNQELQVINITTPFSPVLIGSYNISGNTDALSVAGLDNTILLGMSSTGSVYLFDITTPSAPALVSTYGGQGNINDISLDATNYFAFLGTSGSANEFIAFDFVEATSPTTIGSVNLADTLNGVAYNATKARVVGASIANTEEFVIIKPD